jgi:A/G-specific adenine glycosylase
MSNINASQRRKEQILVHLLAWYKSHGRPLPWRQSSDAYHVWISEVMLQQTQVDTVIPYYQRFLEKFPDIKALADAPLQDVLKAWENMGYYRRAHCLHEAASTIMTRYNGRMPATWDELIDLPGIGAYTAGAILSIAFGKAVAAVDGNVRRVMCRLFAIKDAPDTPVAYKRIEAAALSLVPAGKQAGRFNQALMDLGAMVCTSKSPHCLQCPVRHECLAYARNLQNDLPLKIKGRPVPQRQGVAGILFDGKGRVLVVQRPAQGLLASLWKFPGGIIEPDESPQAGLQRTIYEELGIHIWPESPIRTIKHAYTHFRLALHVWFCTHKREKVQALKCQKWKWAAPCSLTQLPFSKADGMIVSSLSSLNIKDHCSSGRKRRLAATDSI